MDYRGEMVRNEYFGKAREWNIFCARKKKMAKRRAKFNWFFSSSKMVSFVHFSVKYRHLLLVFIFNLGKRRVLVYFDCIICAYHESVICLSFPPQFPQETHNGAADAEQEGRERYLKIFQTKRTVEIWFNAPLLRLCMCKPYYMFRIPCSVRNEIINR